MLNKQTSLKLSAIALAILLASCGGGGSDGYYNQGASSGNTGGSDNGSNEENPDQQKEPVNITDITLLDNTNNTTNVVTSDGVMALVQVTNENGEGIPNTIVRFQGQSIVLGTSNGAVLTDAQGYAKITISPSENKTGAYELTATAEYKKNIATSNIAYFTIAERQTEIKNLLLTPNVIKAGEKVEITLETVDPVTKKPQNDVEIFLTALCGTFENSVTNSVDGKASASYYAVTAGGVPCNGNDTITAKTKDGKFISSELLTINITPPDSIVYSSKEKLLFTNTSGQTTSDFVEFNVQLDGKFVPYQDVKVEILRGPIDLSFVNLGNRQPITVKSDAKGVLNVRLYPGAVPGPVEIKATLANNDKIFAVSRGISIGTGRVTQRGLSLAVDKNALQNRVDGDVAIISARMVDRVGNPVPDGTAVTFVAEGGRIDSRCLTIDGACSVKFATQDYRPKDNRVTVLAYVEGEKSFIDVDGTNIWNKSVETLLHNIGSFYRDDNENGKYDQNLGEFFYRGHNGTLACTTHKSAEGEFPIEKFPNIENTCTDQLDTVIREQLIFSFSPDQAVFKDVKANINNSELSFSLLANNLLSVPMPAGSIVKVESLDKESKCSATLNFGNEIVPNIFNFMTPLTFNSSSQVYYSYRLKDCVENDRLIINVTAPNGQMSKKEVKVIKE